MEPDDVVLKPLAVKKPTAAKVIGCGLTTVYGLCKSGKLKTIKVGADEKVVFSSIEEYVAAGGDK